ncbi:hypothetical protein BSK59_15830 [Paenibacillus odorifer]|uniref:hypothetical protein n=1 Tax=Paenibacillus odorifer TaxID=189426 RepID=UPI00096C19BC|nr:hypothetical protein [Paenibacillus odorifer]OME54050.1 hypothetical protein BSK59_15830 [Paenibacillus odorifer]
MKKYIFEIIWSLVFLAIGIDIIGWSYDLENWFEYVALLIGVLSVLINAVDIIENIISIIKQKQESVE